MRKCYKLQKYPGRRQRAPGLGKQKRRRKWERRALRLNGIRGDGFHDGDDFHRSLRAFVELDVTVAEGEDREIAAEAGVLARMDVRTALSDDDAAGVDELSAVGFDATHFRFAVAAVTAAGLAFFMCHFSFSKLYKVDFQIQETGL